MGNGGAFLARKGSGACLAEKGTNRLQLCHRRREGNSCTQPAREAEEAQAGGAQARLAGLTQLPSAPSSSALAALKAHLMKAQILHLPLGLGLSWRHPKNTLFTQI